MWNVGGIEIVDRNHALVVVMILFTSLSVLAVNLRIFTRAYLVKNVGIDDIFIVFSMLGTIGYIVAVFHQIKFGLGRVPTGPPNPAIIQKFLQSLLATITAYSFTHLTVKFSILFQCRRIFTATSAQRLFTGLIIWLTVYGLFCFLSGLITCVPFAKYWDDSIPGGCIDRSKLHYALAGINIFNDLMLLISPMPYLRNLQIPRRAKIILIGVFLCGGFACIVAIVRLDSLYVNNSAPIDQQPIKGVDIAVWSGLEINVAIICASIPALKPLFTKFFPEMLSNLADSSKRSKNNRSAGDSMPLHSFDNRSNEPSKHPMEIKVHQSFEMKAVTTDCDDDSEKNLVMGGNHQQWTTECYSPHHH